MASRMRNPPIVGVPIFFKCPSGTSSRTGVLPFCAVFSQLMMVGPKRKLTSSAVMTALLVSFLFGPTIISWLKTAQNGNTPVREDVPEGHLKKIGTPTMGGFLILLAISVSTLLWADLRNGYVWVVLLARQPIHNRCANQPTTRC